MRILVLLFMALVAAHAASAEKAPNHYAKACGLTGTSTSVAVDVYDDAAPGSVLATILNAEVSRVGTTDCYFVDLATTTAAISYPAAGDPVPKSYTLRFSDDASNEIWLSELALGLAAVDQVSDRCVEPEFFFAAAPIVTRGITQQVINALKPSYAIYRVSCAGNFGTPDFSWYEIYHYNAQGALFKAVRSTSPPNP